MEKVVGEVAGFGDGQADPNRSRVWFMLAYRGEDEPGVVVWPGLLVLAGLAEQEGSGGVGLDDDRATVGVELAVTELPTTGAAFRRVVVGSGVPVGWCRVLVAAVAPVGAVIIDPLVPVVGCHRRPGQVRAVLGCGVG